MVELTRMGLACQDGEACPAFYLTSHGTVVVQGHSVVDPGALAQIRFSPGEDAVEVPLSVLVAAYEHYRAASCT
ncbi:hypothetical protein L6E12_15315 [Actinokineospora sp. PR83]|uniref:hypothetical protein n=1 Tax=Actinokineospora sp. PR83 TaxID=2884908 RepID=UPI001F4785DD|nr:hypothetical protein [Actinokineospora sp. PR83]MCG8917155.1 hypothetical protein [Actinokineospora sp. PR83]